MSEQDFMLQNAQNLMVQGGFEEGIKILRKLGDHPRALRLLGYSHLKGDGFNKDCDKALECHASTYEHGETDWGRYYKRNNWKSNEESGAERFKALIGELFRDFLSIPNADDEPEELYIFEDEIN